MPSDDDGAQQESADAPSVSEAVSPPVKSKASGETSVQDEKKLKMTVNVHDVIIVLFDTPSIRISVIHARL